MQRFGDEKHSLSSKASSLGTLLGKGQETDYAKYMVPAVTQINTTRFRSKWKGLEA